MKKLLAYSLIPFIAAFTVEGASAKNGKIYLSYLHKHVHAKLETKLCPPRPAGNALSRACSKHSDTRFCRRWEDLCDDDDDDHFAFGPGHHYGHSKGKGNKGYSVWARR